MNEGDQGGIGLQEGKDDRWGLNPATLGAFVEKLGRARAQEAYPLRAPAEVEVAGGRVAVTVRGAMILSVGCTLGYHVVTPTAHFTFNILANTDAQQRLVAETVSCTPEISSERISSSKGNRVLRIEVPTGPFELRYSARIETVRPVLPSVVKPDNPGRLPLTVLTYMLPSRYCESDRFSQVAWELFGRIENRVEQVREICRWVDANLEYRPGSTDSRTSAWDVYQLRKGVCRDYTHLAIALCRALSIPARYVGGYAAGLEPMDFHACFEAYLGGQWHLFDPSDGIAPENIVAIARGRDAANAALTTIFGRVTAGPVKVTCELQPLLETVRAVGA